MSCSFSENIPIWVTDVLTLRDPRRHDIRFKDALRKEIDGLVKRGTWNVMCMRDVSPAVILLGGRFVLSIKSKDTSEKLLKARFVVQGHMDAEKHNLLLSAATLHCHSLRLILALCATLGLRIWTQDIS
jgi:hypothetical protein